MTILRCWPILLLALPCVALEWKTTSLTLATAPFQTTQDVVFEFKNAGTKPVTLLRLDTNCDCLTASAEQRSCAPGASGRISARFTIGDRMGVYERVITLVTDESPEPVRLQVRFEVPDVATLSPRSVEWHSNEPPADKTIDLTAATGLEISFTEAQPTNEEFTATLETIAAGKHYRLHLKPRGTAQPASAAVRVFGREKSGHDVVVSAYVTVQ